MPILSRRRYARAIPRLEARLVALSLLMTFAFATVSVRLYYLQVVRSEQLQNLAERNRIRIRRMPAPRGLVFDRLHRPLVDTRPSFDAVVVPEDSGDLSATIEGLEHYLGEDHIGERLSQAQDDGRPAFEPVTVEERLKWEQVVALEAHQLELPGVSLQVTPRRRYIYGPIAAHLLGYVGEVNSSELQRLATYRLGDEIGKYGLERGWEQFLRGQAGGQQIEVDAVGRRLRLLKEVPEAPGQSTVLTLDLDVQQVAEKAMANQAGALVAIDPTSGEVIAMVSHPAFDPNVFASGINGEQWRKLAVDPGHPLQDRVISGIYPPGSTFKLVDTIAGLQDKAISEQTSFYCRGGLYYGGREYRCWRHQGHGGIALHRAIVESCDVFFYQVGQKVGIDRLAHWANELGLGAKTGIALDNERAGTVPSSSWKLKRFNERWYPAETLSVAIGQGYLNVTPIELAQLAAQIGTGGDRYTPHFVKQIETPEGRMLKTYPPNLEHHASLDPETLRVVRDAMADVVNAPNGTARKARLDGITVCGKTGTAQVIKMAQGARSDTNKMPEQERDHALFIAFAPKENPRIAIACIIEHGGHGGSAAAPVVHDVMQKYFEVYGGAKPADRHKEDAKPAPASVRAPGTIARAETAGAVADTSR